MATKVEKAELGTAASLGKNSLTKKNVIELIKNEQIQVVDCCFTDPLGLWHHCTFAANQIDDEAFDEGLPFDGSSIKMFKVINESDMLMKPDPATAWIDPFLQEKTLHLTCSILEPDSSSGYSRDPRSIAQKAVEYLQSSGIADMAYFGPEAEFFIFDDVRYEVQNNSASYTVDADEGYWNMNKKYNKKNNLAHRVEAKHGYFPVAPIDNHTDIRTEMLLTMGRLGVPIEKHHHEVASAQSELGFRALPLIECADSLQIYKYVIKNVAKKHNKTVTFMPKPIYGDNGTGMHIHSSLWKNGQPLFYDKNGYAGLSDLALHYIGGILHHAKAILAFTNSTTNSYKRLVPGFEAPVNLVYSQGNRSAAIRIPMYHPHNPKAKRAEFRCPDALANPYIAFVVILLAGLDGIKKKIHPGEPLDVDIYELSDGERENIKITPPTLAEALNELEKDHDFLLEGGVFTQDYLDAYIALKRSECKRIETAPHPLEFVMYYHL